MGNKNYQHYIPATYLAQFSSQIEMPRRKSLVWVGNKENGKIFNSPAETIGGENNFYKLTENIENYEVDGAWNGYEPLLNIAIDQLINQSITAFMWATVLVPFIAGLMVRGKDFNQRFEKRISLIYRRESSKDNTNMARMFEIQRILAPILCSRWRVFRTSGSDIPLITNETGYIPFENQETEERGFAVPVSNNVLVVIIPKRKKYIAYLDNNIWRPIIHYGPLGMDNHLAFNKTINLYSLKYLIGCDDSVIRLFLTPEIHPLPEIQQMGFIEPFQRMVHEFLWHRFVAGLARAEKGEDITNFPLDYKSLKSTKMNFPLYFGMNFPSTSIPSDVYREGNKIVGNLYTGIFVR